MCRTLVCRWNGKIAGEARLRLCVCRRISVQGICIAVVPLFIFNDTRKKNVIMACLPQSPPCLWLFELFEIKASGNVAFSDSGVHPRSRSEVILPPSFCSFHLTTASCWAVSCLKEHGPYKQHCKYQNLIKVRSTVFPLGFLCTFDSPVRQCLLRFSPH